MILIRNNTFDEILNNLLNVILSLEVIEEQQLKDQLKNSDFNQNLSNQR